jgi:glutamate--cysteine ligase
MVPHLTTSLTGPLQEIERIVLDQRPEIERWFRNQWQEHEVNFYASVDLLNSGFKLAPVDTNLFPGGFNNLNRVPTALRARRDVRGLARLPRLARFLLVPRTTRNLNYLQNVAVLRRSRGRGPHGAHRKPDSRPHGAHGGHHRRRRLLLGRSAARQPWASRLRSCAVLLNNDLSAGIPAILRDIEQPVIAARRGWARAKSHHFHSYDRVAEDFAKLLGLDPWLLNPAFSQCGKVNFAEKEGEDCLAANVDFVLNEVREKYREYGITEPPFCIVKADAGTYGMGIMTVKSVDDVRNLNRKTRNKMAVIKEGQPVHEVIIQEGVYTFESVDGAVASRLYMMDHFVVGGFYRVHPSAAWTRTSTRRVPSSRRSPSRPTATRPIASVSRAIH